MGKNETKPEGNESKRRARTSEDGYALTSKKKTKDPVKKEVDLFETICRGGNIFSHITCFGISRVGFDDRYNTASRNGEGIGEDGRTVNFVYYLNMAKAKDKNESMVSQLGRTSLKYTRFEGAEIRETKQLDWFKNDILNPQTGKCERETTFRDIPYMDWFFPIMSAAHVSSSKKKCKNVPDNKQIDCCLENVFNPRSGFFFHGNEDGWTVLSNSSSEQAEGLALSTLGCYFSWLRMLEAAYRARPNDFVLFLEDDVRVQNLDTFQTDLQKIVDNAPYFDILKLRWMIIGMGNETDNFGKLCEPYFKKCAKKPYVRINTNLGGSGLPLGSTSAMVVRMASVPRILGALRQIEIADFDISLYRLSNEGKLDIFAHMENNLFTHDQSKSDFLHTPIVNHNERTKMGSVSASKVMFSLLPNLR